MLEIFLASYGISIHTIENIIFTSFDEFPPENLNSLISDERMEIVFIPELVGAFEESFEGFAWLNRVENSLREVLWVCFYKESKLAAVV